MKKFLKISGIVVGVIVAIVIAVGIWQWDNITALITALNETPEQTMQKMAENDAALREELEEKLGQTYREFTEEEKQQIESGEVSEKEVLAKIIAEKATEEENNENPQASGDNASSDAHAPPAGNSGAAGKAPTQSAEKIINKYVSQLYSMESRYLASIDGVLASAYAEYVKTAKHHEDMAAMATVGAKYIQNIYALEAQCDSEVEALLGRLKGELEEIGADTSILATIRSAYANEKQLKRSYYMSKYLN